MNNTNVQRTRTRARSKSRGRATPQKKQTTKKRSKSMPRSKSVPRKTSKKAQGKPVLGGFETRKQARMDPRVTKKTDIASDQRITNAQVSIPVQVVLQPSSIWAFAVGYVTRAFEHGVFASASNPANPYYAFVYLVQILNQFAAGGIPKVSQLPYAILAFGRAISPKSHQLDNGRVSYAFYNTSTTNPLQILTTGYNPYGFSWNANSVPAGATPVSGFPLSDSTPFGAYNDALGQSAFSEMNLFLAQRAKSDAYKSVPSNSSTSLDSDVSVFANVKEYQGLGFAGIGSVGIGAQAEMECAFWKPYFSSFNVISATPQEFNRQGNMIRPISGDGCWIGGTIGQTFPEELWGRTRYSFFKCVDFMQFLELTANWIRGIQQAAADELSVTLTDPARLKCPLTLQEVGMLLRNVFMTAFKETQAAAQGIYPAIPASGTANEFVPFVSSATTCLLEPVDMTLPALMVENIRDLSMRQTAGVSATDVSSWVPVVGQYYDDTLDQADYSYTFDGTPYPSFMSTAGLWEHRTRNVKSGEVVVKALAEETLSYVDGSGTSGLVAINNPAQLKTLVMQWNDWFNGSGLASFSRRATTLGTDKGINVCFSGNTTRHWITPPDALLSAKRRTVDVRMERRKWANVTASPNANKLAIADTFQSEPLASVYEQVQSIWILPVNKVQTSASVSTAVQKIRALYHETYLVNLSSGEDGVTIAQQLQSYASKMVKSRLAPPDDLDAFLAVCAERGRGGVLSGLVANFAGAMFPQVKGIADTIASALPF